MTAPSKEARDAAMARINHNDYKSVDEFIAAVDKLARYIETGEISSAPVEGEKQ